MQVVDLQQADSGTRSPKALHVSPCANSCESVMNSPAIRIQKVLAYRVKAVVRHLRLFPSASSSAVSISVAVQKTKPGVQTQRR